jgi:hypothetical protein
MKLDNITEMADRTTVWSVAYNPLLYKLLNNIYDTNKYTDMSPTSINSKVHSMFVNNTHRFDFEPAAISVKRAAQAEFIRILKGIPFKIIGLPKYTEAAGTKLDGKCLFFYKIKIICSERAIRLLSSSIETSVEVL